MEEYRMGNAKPLEKLVQVTIAADAASSLLRPIVERCRVAMSSPTERCVLCNRMKTP